MKLLFFTLTFLFVTSLSGQDSSSTKIPFDGMDLTWINGQNRQVEFTLKYKDVLTAVSYLDTYYNCNLAHPVDHTQTISSTIGRTDEFTLNLASIGIESNYKNAIGRIWIQTGNMLHIVQEPDGSVLHGRNTGTGNLKYIREAAAGYHFNKWYGINVEMGMFMSYIGLESYVTQENWCYQRSMVCEFTPFYFQGARIQLNPCKKFQSQIWLLNGWQSYNTWNKNIGFGNSNYFRPTENLQLVANFYYGNDTRNSNLIRFHHDNSIVVRYYKNKASEKLSQAAFSINTHFGFQMNDSISSAEQYMAGLAIANRFWFYKNKLALTTRGDYVTNPGLYLAYSPSPVAPNDFTDAIGSDPLRKLDIFQATATLDIMPSDIITFRIEYNYRQSNVPYFAGPGGTTSPDGWINTPVNTWRPDLRKTENRLTVALNFRL